MRHVDIKTKIPELIEKIPDWETFVRLGNLTKLRVAADGSFQHANYESGLLLYAIVRHFRPQRVLEIGTGRGYGAFCMAMAMRDSGFEGRIITVDPIPGTQQQVWPIDDGRGPRIENLALQEVWESRLDPALRSMIELRQGISTSVMEDLIAAHWHPHFIYIDGDHTFASARHDFFAALLMAARPFRMLLDDYTPGEDIFGVRRMVDRWVAPIFEAEAIFNDRRWHGEERENEPLDTAKYAQVLLDSDKTKQALDQALPTPMLQKVVRCHRRWGWLAVKYENAITALRRRSAPGP